METLLEMLRRRDLDGIWRRYCGFLDLAPAQFQQAQDRLLAEQLVAWRTSRLVRRVFGGTVPATVAEFRERAPLTTYEDYADVLLQRNDAFLVEPTYEWVRTSGRSGPGGHKWVPVTRGMYQDIADAAVGVFIHGTCTRRGEIRLRERDRVIFALAPLPFISGLALRAMREQFNFRTWPPYDQAIRMEYAPRLQDAIRLSYLRGLDYIWGITSQAVALSEQMQDAGRPGSPAGGRAWTRDPRAVVRRILGRIRSRVRGSPLRPRDIWNVKGVLTGGMDTASFRERVRSLWGQYPREVYACAELGFLAHTHYAGGGLVMRHTAGYLEFIPLEDYRRWKDDRSVRPPLLRLSELREGCEYALVGTSFKGGVLVRYVIGDSLAVLSLRDEAAGVHVPQFEVRDRVDDVIDVAGFTRLTERTIWTAVEQSGVPYVDWVVAKEAGPEGPVLHLYLEPRGEAGSEERVRDLVHERLRQADEGYRDLQDMAGIRPLAVTLLSAGTFARYFKERLAAGHDTAHSRPCHMNPKAEAVSRLRSMSGMRL